jgi:hypothetical protein
MRNRSSFCNHSLLFFNGRPVEPALECSPASSWPDGGGRTASAEVSQCHAFRFRATGECFFNDTVVGTGGAGSRQY